MESVDRTKAIMATVERINTNFGKGRVTGLIWTQTGARAQIQKQYGQETLDVTLLPGNKLRFRGHVRSIFYGDKRF